MTDFIETPRFPTDISFGSRGGPTYNTRVVQNDSGALLRNQLWTYPQHRYDVAYGINTRAKMETLLAFFHSIAIGRATGFRYKDWMDYKSCSLAGTPSSVDCWLGNGTGALSTFQLRKVYNQGASYAYRTILKPVSGTVLISVNSVTKTETTHYTVNYTTGVVTFTGGNIPGNGESVGAGFEFDVPVIFESDALDIALEGNNIRSAQIMLIELKYGST